MENNDDVTEEDSEARRAFIAKSVAEAQKRYREELDALKDR